VAVDQFASVTGAVSEYRKSYRNAEPVPASSPGAVQVSVAELCVTLATERSATVSGATRSSGSSEAPTARRALRRPPVTVSPARLGTGSTVARICALVSSTLMPGNCAMTRAAVPATCGAAIEGHSDSAIDMQTARNAGFAPLGVLWGFRGREELLESGARWLAATPAEILPIYSGER
jgi:hypothetical protein